MIKTAIGNLIPWRRQWENDPLRLGANCICVSRFGEQVLWRVHSLVPCNPKWVYLSNTVFVPYAITHLQLSNSDAAEVNYPNGFLHSSILLCSADSLEGVLTSETSIKKKKKKKLNKQKNHLGQNQRLCFFMQQFSILVNHPSLTVPSLAKLQQSNSHQMVQAGGRRTDTNTHINKCEKLML